MRHAIALCLAAVVTLTLSACTAPLAPRDVDPAKVRIRGEIGRRIDITVGNNVLKIDNDTVFLKSFRKKDRGNFSYVGLGKHIDAVVRLAYHTGDKRLIALKDRLITELLKTQLDSGYIGVFADPGVHMDTETDRKVAIDQGDIGPARAGVGSHV